MTQASFDWGNEVLYRMCRDNPSHHDKSVVVGKIWIIGRSYSASIERKAGPKMVSGQNFYLRQAAPKIAASQIDAWIAKVKSIKRITNENLHEILWCHKKVTDLFTQISGIEKRSLASKYLHFHVPGAFFIYDSIASRTVASLTIPVRQSLEPILMDKAYASFCRRCLVLRDEIEKKRRRHLSNRELDSFLLAYQRPRRG